jgi:hypothetical protein
VRSSATVRAVAVVVIGLAGAYGLVLRLWLLAHTPVNSDWAVAGLMAKSILSGHFWTFYWGQQYGGVEPYLVAPVVWLSGGSPWAMGATAALLSAVAAVLVGLVVGASTGRGWLGWAAGTLAWIWPYAVVWNSIREYGFRGVTMACGLLALWMAVRIHRGPTRVVDAAVLGLAVGIGWWSSPELVYFAAPVAVVVVLSWGRLFDRTRRLVGPWRPGPVFAAVVGAGVGALPWLYTNIGTGFASLQTGSLPSYRGLGYGARLRVFFDDMLPVQLGVRTVPGGAWVGGRTVGPVLYGIVGAVVVVVVVAALGSARRGRAAAPALAAAAGIVLFPFLYALVPSTGYWVDGRYGVYLPAFIAIAAGVVLAGARPAVDPAGARPAVDPAGVRPAVDPAGVRPAVDPAGVRPAVDPAGARPAVDLAATPPDLPPDLPSGIPSHVRGHRAGAHRRHRRRRGAAALAAGTAGLVAATVGLVGAGGLTGLAARAGGVPARPGAFASGWRDPEAPVRQIVAAMDEHGLRYAYGTYWTAYVLDYVAGGRVVVTPSPLDVVRLPSDAAAVAASPGPAWLFYPTGHTAAAAAAFANPETGPGNYTEAQFESLLTGRHVPYTVVHVGVLDAVVPARRITLPK